MNFSVFRFLTLFSAAFVAIAVLTILEITLLLLSADSGGGVGFAIWNYFVRLCAYWALQILDHYDDIIFIFFFGAFAVPALIEGQKYFDRNLAAPPSVKMLTGSAAMALTGLGAICVFPLLTNYLADGSVWLQGVTFTSWQVFIFAATFVAASLVCRVSFGVGLHLARKQQSTLTGEYS